MIVSSAMMASMMTVPNSNSETYNYVQKSDVVFAADSEIPTESTSLSLTTTTTTTRTTTTTTTSSTTTTTTTTTEQDELFYKKDIDRFDRIINLPTKTIYDVGEELDLRGLVIRIWYWTPQSGGYLRKENVFEIEKIDPKYILITDPDGKIYNVDDFPKLPGDTSYTVRFSNENETFINVKAKGDSDEREVYNLSDFNFQVYINPSDNDSKFLRIDNTEVEEFTYGTENGVKLKDTGSFTIDKETSTKEDHIMPDGIKKGDILSGVLYINPNNNHIYYGDLELVESDYYDDPYALQTRIPKNTEKNWTLDENGLLTISGPGPYFFKDYLVKKILIQDNVTVIEDDAFKDCHSLVSVTIPDSITNIGSHAFYGCSSLESITIPDSVISIGDCAFSYCQKLKSITLPDSLLRIGNCAFSDCSSIESLSIPDSVTRIGRFAFERNSSLTSVILPDSINRISISMFYDCTNLESINIPDTIKSIESDAFRNCNSLVSINIPDSVTSIEEAAFIGCDKIQSITIPVSVTNIGKSAFSVCDALKSVTFTDSPADIGDSAFSSCENLESVDLSSSITSIGNNAFSNCNKLGSIIIPDSVTSLGQSIFTGCKNLESITLPSTFKTQKFVKVVDYPDRRWYLPGEELNIKELRIRINGVIIDELDYSFFKIKDFIITDKDGNTVSGDQLSTLPAGDYTVSYKSAAILVPENWNIDFEDFEFSYIIQILEPSDESILWGDTNLDGEVDMGDAIIIMQSLSNPQKYGVNGTDENHITEEGLLRGDVDISSIGLTSNDALTIQKFLINKIYSLDPILVATTVKWTQPIGITTTTTTTTTTTIKTDFCTRMYTKFDSVVSYPTKTVYETGDDLDINGIVISAKDGNTYNEKYFNKDYCTVIDKNGETIYGKDFNTLPAGEYTIKTQELLYPDFFPIKIDDIDVSYKVTIKNKSNKDELFYGDANCDSIIDMADAVLIMQALANPNKYDLNGTSQNRITYKGKLQADVETITLGLTSNDALKIQLYLLRKISTLVPSEATTTTNSTTTTAPITTTTTSTTTTISPYGTEIAVMYNGIYSYPTKTVYNVGEELDFDGLIVKNQSGYQFESELQYPPYEFSTKNCTITGINGKSVSGDEFNTLPAGRYTVYYKDRFFKGVTGAGVHTSIEVSYEVTIEEATEKKLKEKEQQLLQ